jgi:hypothetical protein
LIRQFKGRGPALVMLTANAMAESREASLAAGADGFLSKPFVESDLLRLIEGILARQCVRGASQASSRVAAPLARDLLARLDQNERELLVRAAVSLNPAEIDAAIGLIATRAPTLAERLRSLSRRRSYQELWDLLGIEGSEA